MIDRARDQVSQALVESLKAIEQFKVKERENEPEARKELEDGDASYLLIVPEGLAAQITQQPTSEPVAITLLYDRGDQTAPIIIGTVQQFIEEMNRQILQTPTLLELKPEGIQSRQLTYFDFLLPGFVGMGVMTYSVIGLAAAMALYREQKILKRILATPLKVRTFFASQIIAHLVLSVLQAVVILAAGVLIFGGHIYGNFLWLLVLVVIANVVFLNLGFIVGPSRKTSVPPMGWLTP
ncbi:MAG: ABC transporter permease [Chloroflexi bacterium]|nr:ABC transporter permease [Chloroflexota bacterium]